VLSSASQAEWDFAPLRKQQLITLRPSGRSDRRLFLAEARRGAMEEPVEQDNANDEEMLAHYKTAVERSLPRIPVKNGVVDIDSIWVETSLPYDLLLTILRRDDLALPPNIERIHLKSRAQQGEPSGKRKRRKRREVWN
jgi:hypothetical protein